MRIIKEIETNLTIFGSDIFSPDREITCTRLLTEKYAGKNFKSCHIINIHKILEVSSRRMNETLDGSANINVRFEVNAIVYVKDEIIHGCKVVEKDANGVIRFISPNAALYIEESPDYAGICNVGDIIPTIVLKVGYTPNQTQITAAVMPFVPLFNKPIVYKIEEKKVECYIKVIKVDDDKTTKFFANLLYPYKKYAPKPKKMTFVEMNKIPNIRKGYLVIPTGDIYLNGAYHTFEHTIAKKHGTVVEHDIQHIYQTYISEYTMYKDTLEGFKKTYPLLSDVKKYKKVWEFYLMLKK